MERQEGYYWVKYRWGFEIGFWDNERSHWQICGRDDDYQDKEFEHINENRIKFPGELPD